MSDQNSPPARPPADSSLASLLPTCLPRAALLRLMPSTCGMLLLLLVVGSTHTSVWFYHSCTGSTFSMIQGNSDSTVWGISCMPHMWVFTSLEFSRGWHVTWTEQRMWYGRAGITGHLIYIFTLRLDYAPYIFRNNMSVMSIQCYEIFICKFSTSSWASTNKFLWSCPGLHALPWTFKYLKLSVHSWAAYYVGPYLHPKHQTNVV